jgi:Rhodopirellula transposase DDE domain
VRVGHAACDGANTKTIEGKQHPDRDAQFRYINAQVKDYQHSADPVISVDTKKKELVGQFSNAGRQWRPTPDASTPAPGRVHHPAGTAPAGHPQRPPQPRDGRRHHRPDRHQDGALN